MVVVLEEMQVSRVETAMVDKVDLGEVVEVAAVEGVVVEKEMEVARAVVGGAEEGLLFLPLLQ